MRYCGLNWQCNARCKVGSHSLSPSGDSTSKTLRWERASDHRSSLDALLHTSISMSAPVTRTG